jgi:hypothetical protein
MSALGGGFNRSTQHLLIVWDWEVSDGGECTDTFTPQHPARRKRHVRFTLIAYRKADFRKRSYALPQKADMCSQP